MVLRTLSRLVSRQLVSDGIGGQLRGRVRAAGAVVHCRTLASVPAPIAAQPRDLGDPPPPQLQSLVPHGPHASKVIFSDHRVYDFKYIWLRDNCRCPQCLDQSTKQKLVDTTLIDVSIRPKSVELTDDELVVVWPETPGLGDRDAAAGGHRSVYSSKWLYKYGRGFASDYMERSEAESARASLRPAAVTWDRTEIWRNFPEISHREFMQTDEGLVTWLGLIHKYGLAVIRGVPLNKSSIIDVVRRFAYVKETSYGVTFDVISEPSADHLANTGRRLELHTDMNYREKSPGLQLLHCIRSHDVATGRQVDVSQGKSFFVDGFRVAEWLESNHPSSYHILTTTPVKFSITTNNLRYSQHWPVICADNGEVTEIHCNNRTLAPIQAASHVVMAFYHAYKRFTEKSRDPTLALKFNLVPGDIIAFNNRRVMHGRTEFDPSKVSRHLIGCYVDIDEAMTKYDQLLARDRKAWYDV